MHTLNLRSFLWFVTGVALTVTSVATFGTWRADAAVTPGESTFVPIAPCRLFDSRPTESIPGSNTTPIAAKQTRVQQVTGSVGNCNIPAGVSGVAMNVTIVNPTARSFLVLFPADETTLPVGSNLNWAAGQGPTPNKVGVKLSPDGKVKIYNNAGTIDILADIVGYYQSSTVSQLSADVAALQATVTQQQADIKNLLEDTNVIPSGVTVSGYENWDFESVRDDADVYFTVQLPGTAPAPFTVSVADDPKFLAVTPDLSCTGTSANPTAPAGKVCIYLASTTGVDGVEGFNAEELVLTAFDVIFTIDDATPSDDAYLVVTWAYTAP